MKDRETRLGRFKGFRLAGTTRAQGPAVTYVRMDFERASVYNRYLWGPEGTLLDTEAGPIGPETMLLPLSATEFVPFQPLSAATLRITFEPGVPGRTPEMVLHQAQKAVRAQRIKATPPGGG